MTIVSGITSGIRSTIQAGINPGGVAAPRNTITVSAPANGGGSNTNDRLGAAQGTEFETASITATAGRTYIFDVLSMHTTGTVSAPTITGLGLTWTLLATVTTGSGVRRLSRYRGTGTPSAGVIRMTHDQTVQSCAWAFTQAVNVASIRQTTTNTQAAGTTVTGTLAALENAANVCLSTAGASINGSFTPDAGFTELTDNGVASNNGTTQASWGTNKLTSTPTASGTGAIAVIVSELVAT